MLVAAAIVFSRSQVRYIGAGLVPAFLVGFALRYWLAAALYALPTPAENFNPDLVATGLRVSTFALIAFGAGSLVLAPALWGSFRRAQSTERRYVPQLRLAQMYIAIGLVCFLVLLPIIGRLPTVNSIIIQGWGLMIAGLGLACWHAWHHRRGDGFMVWLAIALSLPLLTVVTQGFLGYGAAASTAVLALLASFYRPRWQTVLVGPVVAYLALSLYVTYMRDREEIRRTEGLVTRAQGLYASVQSLEWFDLSNQQHVDRIDVRLNQDYLVGAAVENLDAGVVHFAYAQTIWDGLLSFVPRVIWPSKPFIAGSGKLVSQYTGLTFDSNTAVGIGLVMESYISFGLAGVLVAFSILGAILTTIDRTAGQCLRRGDWPSFVRWFLPGLALLQMENSVVELTSSVGAAVVAAWLANRLATRQVPLPGGGSASTTSYTRMPGVARPFFARRSSARVVRM
jgi:hypothetical protein